MDELRSDLEWLIRKYNTPEVTKEQLALVTILYAINGLTYEPEELMKFAKYTNMFARQRLAALRGRRQ